MGTVYPSWLPAVWDEWLMDLSFSEKLKISFPLKNLSLI
jgi:hypothetical protein